MATDNNDIFPEDITKMLEKMDKTIEENSSNLNADVQITVHTNSDNTDINNSFINLNKQIDDTLDSLDRRVDQHKGAFDIWNTFGIELDSSAFGSDDANKDRAEKDAIYDQLSLLAKALNKDPKLLGTLTSLNKKHLKIVVGEEGEQGYLDQATKVIGLENGVIDKRGYREPYKDFKSSGFVQLGSSVIASTKVKDSENFNSTLFHEYGHLLLQKALDDAGIYYKHGDDVNALITRIKEDISHFKRFTNDLDRKIHENELFDLQLSGTLSEDDVRQLLSLRPTIEQANEQIQKDNVLLRLFTSINNSPSKYAKDTVEHHEYINDAHEVFARSFTNYVAGISNITGNKGVNSHPYDIDYTNGANTEINDAFMNLFASLEGRNISDNYNELIEKIAKKKIVNGLSSSQIAKILSNIGNSPDIQTGINQLERFNNYLLDYGVDVSQYNFSPTSISRIFGGSLPNSKNPEYYLKLLGIMGLNTEEKINNIENLERLGESIRDMELSKKFDDVDGMYTSLLNIQYILHEIGYDNLSKEEIKSILSGLNLLKKSTEFTEEEKADFKNFETSLDSALSRIPSSMDSDENIHAEFTDKVKEQCYCFNGFEECIKSLADTFKTQFESAIENSANAFKLAFESAITSYGDVLARVGNGKNPFTTDNTFTGGYNPELVMGERGTPFVTKDGRKLYSQKAINEYNQAQLRDSGAFVTDMSVVPEVLQKSQPLLLTYDPSATFAYTQQKHESDFGELLKRIEPEYQQPFVEKPYIQTTPTPNYEYLNMLTSAVPHFALNQKLNTYPETPLMLTWNNPTLAKNDSNYDFETIVGENEQAYSLIPRRKRKSGNRGYGEYSFNASSLDIKNIVSDSLYDYLDLNESEYDNIEPYGLGATYKAKYKWLTGKSKRKENTEPFLLNVQADNFGKYYGENGSGMNISDSYFIPDYGMENYTKSYYPEKPQYEILSQYESYKSPVLLSTNEFKSTQDILKDEISRIDTEIKNDSEEYFKNARQIIEESFELSQISGEEILKRMIVNGHYDPKKHLANLNEQSNEPLLLEDKHYRDMVDDTTKSNDEYESTVEESVKSFKEVTESNKKLKEKLEELGLDFQTFSKTDRTIITAGKTGFDAGGKAKSVDWSTESWITYEKDEKSGEFHFKTAIPDDKKTLKEFMDVNESVVHMQKHLEDYYRFQHNNKTNMEVTPLEYLNYKYAERATNLQKRMTDTDSGFASTIYKVGGVEHTYEELMKSDEILKSKLASFEELANQIAHANDVDEKTGQSVNPLTTYKWLRELSELEKDIKKRTANAIKEQQTIYKELSDISKEGEKIADEGIKQADKMLASDSSYKSIFGKYKIPELSRSGKFSLTDSEKAITEFYKNQIKQQRELLKDDSLKKDAREKIRDEIKKLNGELDNYVTGALADRAREVSKVEDDYKKNILPALGKFNKTFGNIFNTNADLDFGKIQAGGFGKIKELSKLINLDNIFNINNVKRYASDLSKNISTMFTTGIRMFESAFSKISSIVGKVIKSVTIAITGAVATVTAAITGFVAGFTAMGKSIVSATDVYRKQTIALSGVYQSPTKTNRMINTVYNVTRSMPINYTQAVQTLSEMSAIPALQTILKSNDTQKSDQLLQKMFKVITAMTTMRPDQKSSDAIFSLRNAFAGDLRSLQRRFDLPTSNIMNVRGTMGLAAVKTDPMAMLDSLENYFDSFLDVGTINKISDTISVIVEKIKGAIDLFKANIGNAGFYELVAEDFRKIRDVVVNFVTSEDGKNLAKRISDVFGNVYESVKSMAVKVKDIIAGVFNIDSNTLSGMFMKGLEFFAKSVNYIDKLLNVETVTKFVKDLVKTIVDSKDTVLGYIDDIKNKFIDIISPVLKFGSIVMDVTNDIVNALKKTGLSDKGIIYLWLLGPSNVLNMTIAGIGAINAAVKLLITTTGVLYYTLSGVYGLLKPMLAMVTASLSKILIPIGAVLAKVLVFATIGDLIYSNWDKLKEVFDPILTIVNTLISTTIDGFELIGTAWNSIWDIDNLKNTVVAVTDLVSDGIRLGLAKAAQYIPGLSFITNMGDPNIAFENAKNDFSSHLEKNHFVSDDVKQSFKQFWESVKAMPEIIKEGFKPWTTPSKYEWNSGHIIPYIKNKVNSGLNWTGDKITSADKYISSIPQKIENFFNWLVSDSKSDSDILNNSNKTLGFIKNGLDYIVNNIKTKSTSTIGKTLDNIVGFTSNPINSIGQLFTSYFTSSNPILDVINKINGTTLNSYSAPYESPMWNKRLTSMALDVDRLQFQRGSIWSKNSKSDKAEKMFKTDYGEFGFGGLQELNLKKLDNLKNINKILDEVGKVKLNEKDQKDFDKNFQQNLETARKKTEEIDNLIRDNIEASVMLMQDALGSSKLNYLKNDVMQFVMAKNRQLNSQLEQDMNDSIRLQYAVYFASTNEFDETLIELRKKYHDVNDMYSDISNGNVDLKNMTELGRQILTEFAKRYEAERDYLWNLEKQRAYIEVTNQNINKMGLSELSGNWSNLMNSPYKKIRDAAGNQYMDIMKENLETDSVGSMVRKVRDIAINSFTDMKNAIINAVQEIVKSTQQTIKNGLDKLISDGGTIKPMFKELFENIKKNFFGIYTNEASNKLTEFIYGSSFEDNKAQDPMIKLDTDIKDFNTSVLQKIDEVIASNEKFLNDAFNKWLEENNKSKQETPLYRGSAYIVEKQGSMLDSFENSNNNISTVVGITAEEFARNAKAVAENTNTVNECAKGYRKNLDTFAGGVAYAGKKLFGFDDNIIDANDYYRALQNNKNFNTIKFDETKSLLSQLKIGDTLSWWNGKEGKEMKQHIGVYVGNGQLASDHIEDMKKRDWLQWRLDSGYGMPQVSRLATSKTVEKQISSIDNNIEEIKNEITNVTNGDVSSITRTGYSEINTSTINNIINNTTGTGNGFDLNGIFGGFNIPSGIADLGNRAGFGVIGNAISKASGLSVLKSLFSTGSKSNSSNLLNLVFNKDKGYFDSATLTSSGSNILNTAINAAGAGISGIGGVFDVAQMMNLAGADLQKPQTPLKGIWGELFGTVENVESKFGGAAVGSMLGNMMAGKGLVDSLGAVALKTFGEGTEGAKMIAGSNTLTKSVTGLTSTLFGKSAGQSVAKFLGKNFLGTTVGTALPIIGTVAKVLSGKGWFGGAKDRTAEGRARGEEFNTLRSSLIANRNTMARNYYMANRDTLDALQNYQFSEVAMWTSKRGSKWKGTRRTIMNTDATAFTKSMTGYWDLLEKADKEQRAMQLTLNKLQNTNNMEYLKRTGEYEETRYNSVKEDLEKYKEAVSKYAGHDTGFKQKLFDGKEYTLTELNDKVNDLIKELGDSNDAIVQNTEAIRQEKLATEDAKLDYETALYGKYDPLLSYQNEIKKLENEWNSIVTETPIIEEYEKRTGSKWKGTYSKELVQEIIGTLQSVGYTPDTKEWYEFQIKFLQATENLEEATENLKNTISTDWISSLKTIQLSNGNYDSSQVKTLKGMYTNQTTFNDYRLKSIDKLETAIGDVSKTQKYSDNISDLLWHWGDEKVTGTGMKFNAITNLSNLLNSIGGRLSDVSGGTSVLDTSAYFSNKGTYATLTGTYDKDSWMRYNYDYYNALTKIGEKYGIGVNSGSYLTRYDADKYKYVGSSDGKDYWVHQNVLNDRTKINKYWKEFTGMSYDQFEKQYAQNRMDTAYASNVTQSLTGVKENAPTSSYQYLVNTGQSLANTFLQEGNITSTFKVTEKKLIDSLSLVTGKNINELPKIVEKAFAEAQKYMQAEIEHYKANTAFKNTVRGIMEGINNIFDNVDEKISTKISENIDSILLTITESDFFIKENGYQGYDQLNEEVILPLIQSIGNNFNDMASVYANLTDSGYVSQVYNDTMQELQNSLMDKLIDFQEQYRIASMAGASEKELQEIVNNAMKTTKGLKGINELMIELNDEFASAQNLLYQSNAKTTVLGSLSGYDDYEIGNTALKEFNDTLGKNAMNKLLGVQNGMTDFSDETMSKWFGVSGEDPYETYYEYQKKTILQRIKNEKEGSEEWYNAELDLWNLMQENAKYLKEKAEKTTASIEEMLGKIEETAKMRVAEEAKSQKGDIIFFDLGASRNGTQFINSMLKAIKTNDPDAQKLIAEFKKKNMGI